MMVEGSAIERDYMYEGLINEPHYLLFTSGNSSAQVAISYNKYKPQYSFIHNI